MNTAFIVVENTAIYESEFHQTKIWDVCETLERAEEIVNFYCNMQREFAKMKRDYDQMFVRLKPQRFVRKPQPLLDRKHPDQKQALKNHSHAMNMWHLENEKGSAQELEEFKAAQENVWFELERLYGLTKEKYEKYESHPRGELEIKVFPVDKRLASRSQTC